MAENKNQGFVNLRAIHELQVGGSIQSLLRNIRSSKVQLDQLQTDISVAKKKFDEQKKVVEEKVVEVKTVEPEIVPLNEEIAYFHKIFGRFFES